MTPRLVLKVDVDTYAGTLEGVPRLLDLFAAEGIRATFFFSLGPDNTGKAVKRIFRKGFVRKVLRSSPAASYGIRTMLYGTLLPAPDIGASPRAVARMQEVKSAGHERGIHAWDHVDWHDRLPSMAREEIDAVVAKEHGRFTEVFGERALLSAAPGWTATPLSAAVQEAHGIRVTSDTRGGEPFFPLLPGGRPSTALEMPSTLPTLDELLSWDVYAGGARSKTIDLYRDLAVRGAGTQVHSIHTEIEGGRALHPLFRLQVAAWKEAGVVFVPMGEAAGELLSRRESIPARALSFTAVPGRATPVATGLPA